MGRNSLAQQRRTQIIQAFYRCVVKDGLAKASIRKIAKEAQMQPSALHHYFKDRDEMIEEMVAYYADLFFESFLAEMDKCKDPAERFDTAARFLFSPAMVNEEASSFFYDCCAEAGSNVRVRKSLARLFRKFRGVIINYVSELDLPQGVSTDQIKEIATLIIAVHEGVELQYYMNPEDVSLDRSMKTVMGVIEMALQRFSQ